MNLKRKGMLLILLLLVLFAIVFGGATMMSDSIYTDKTNYTDDDSSASVSDDDDANGGGGGGSSDSTDTPSTTDEGCVGDCPSVWIEDEAVRSSKFDFFGLSKIMLPLMGHWECDGVCKDKDELCIFDPIDVIPSSGFIDVNSPPNCVCLEPRSGPCNFYDANYGVGDENIKCGGSCPEESQCMKFNYDNVDVCRCMYSQDSDECGLHYPEQYLKSSTGELVVPGEITKDDCYGYCDTATVCTFGYETDYIVKAEVPVCYCPESPAQQDDDEDEEVIYCEDIKSPKSQADCDAGMCTVLMYGVKCTYIENTLGFTECVCMPPEDTDEQDDYVPDKSLTDQIFASTKLDTFFK